MLGGNALFIFDKKLRKSVTLVILHSEFAYGIHTSEGYDKMGYGHIRGGSGLGVAYQGFYRNMKILISDCIFYNNTAFIGANLFLDWVPYRAKIQLNIIRCKFYNGKAYLKGGGMYIHTWSSGEETEIKVQILHCFFENNFGKQGGGLFLDSRNNPTLFDRHDNEFVLNNCSFKQNAANNGGGIYAAVKSHKKDTSTSRNDNTIQLMISNTKFLQNSAIESGGSIHF